MHVAKPSHDFTPNFGAARLSRANLENANLSEARAQFVDFREANMRRAIVVGTLLQGADMRKANLQYADLSYAELKGANLSDCILCGAKLGKTKGLTQFQLESAFGDAATRLPKKLHKPKHWAGVPLDDADAISEWRKWQADPEGYVPPGPPGEV